MSGPGPASVPRVAVVVPMRDEEPNVAPLLDELWPVLMALDGAPAWIVDDGSTDRTAAAVRGWRTRHGARDLNLLRFERSRGQSAAVLAGVEAARAHTVLIMDGDRQNDPADFAGMLALVEQDRADAVVGVRAQRRDSWVRRASSRIGNGVRDLVTGDRARDSACGIKGLRRDLYLSLPRFDGMHRFVPTLARSVGGRVVEYDVSHRPRPAGVPKYGIRNRAWRGLRDCYRVRKLVRQARAGAIFDPGALPIAGAVVDDQHVA